MFACCPTPGTDKTGEMKQLAEGCGACIKRCPAPLGRGLVQLADGRHEARLAVRDQRARRVAQRVAVPGARAAAVRQGFASMPLGGRRSPVPKLPLGPRRAGSRRPDNKACRQCCYAARTTGMSAKSGRTWRQSWSAARSGPRSQSSAPGRQTCRCTRRPRGARPAPPPPVPSQASQSRCATAAARPRFFRVRFAYAIRFGLGRLPHERMAPPSGAAVGRAPAAAHAAPASAARSSWPAQQATHAPSPQRHAQACLLWRQATPPVLQNGVGARLPGTRLHIAVGVPLAQQVPPDRRRQQVKDGAIGLRQPLGHILRRQAAARVATLALAARQQLVQLPDQRAHLPARPPLQRRPGTMPCQQRGKSSRRRRWLHGRTRREPDARPAVPSAPLCPAGDEAEAAPPYSLTARLLDGSAAARVPGRDPHDQLPSPAQDARALACSPA